ncbi:unnamed protein product [Didymodactylos carnosus]|uniref:Uncharacterized protein n=1 Tax=Didymodactylos carnosus TaxID=1234261 RepID=A0A816B4Z6_9BILA|nr:unnamed protein product [Didymodactylos carnosus]CAF4483215.1 unnamed protein product [Didymodactylos carnosus]
MMRRTGRCDDGGEVGSRVPARGGSATGNVGISSKLPIVWGIRRRICAYEILVVYIAFDDWFVVTEVRQGLVKLCG